MKQPSVFWSLAAPVKAGLSLAATAAAIATSAVVIPMTVSAAPPASDVSTRLAGKTVFLDPGHQGPNTTLDLNRPVPDGRGGTKPCQTTGMTSLHGVPEHTINWNVAQLVKQSLQALGARVVLSRQDDTGSSDCIDARAAAANRSGADVAISIHADGAPAQDHGFHLIVPQLPVPDVKAGVVQAGPGLAATRAVRDAYVKAGFQEANYGGGVDGLQTRSDIAGPALTEVPDVFIEMGNGANDADASLLETPEGQLKHAIAITTGLVGYLLGTAPAPPPAPGGSAGGPAASVVPAQVPGAPAQPAPGAPGRIAPSAYTPGQAAPGGNAPGQAVPGGNPPGLLAPGGYTPGRTPPGNTPPGQPAPGASIPVLTSPPGYGTQPGSPAIPGPLGGTQSTTSAVGSLVGIVMQLLQPLAQSLGLGDQTGVISGLANLAYSLVSGLIGPGIK
jgi:N-acetylmuramoyl-L-alanine amidase